MSFVGYDEARQLLYKHRDKPAGSDAAWDEAYDLKYRKDEHGNVIYNSANVPLQHAVQIGEKLKQIEMQSIIYGHITNSGRILLYPQYIGRECLLMVMR